MITCANAARRVDCLFNANVEYAIRLQDCMANAESGDSKFHGEGREPRTGSLGTFMDSFQWYWEIKIAPKLCRVAAVFFGLLSLVIIVSECTLSFTNTYDTIVFQFFKNIFSGTYTQTMVCTLILLGYLCFCTFYGIFSFRVSGFYGLYPYHQTEPSNLVYSALYVAKLAAPLCVNFLMVIHYENNQETVFDKVAGRGMSWSFVSSFLRYIPCFILILCVMYFFNVYSIIMKHMDMEEYTYYNFYDPEKLEDGARVLTTERDRRSRERTLGRRATARVRDYRPKETFKQVLIEDYIA